MIILATYTGSLGAYLSSAYTVPTLNTYSDLVDGDYSVAVVGPRWNDSDPASPYSGQYMGGYPMARPSLIARLCAASRLLIHSVPAPLHPRLPQLTPADRRQTLLAPSRSSSTSRR